LLFLALGFFTLVVFDQGQDILKSLSLTGSSEIVRQTVFVLFAVSWWSWQSFRSARVILHFFDFVIKFYGISICKIRNIKTSTAIGLSARFPFITPPALIKDRNGNTYGNLVDGGYYENLGMQSMLDLYTILKKLSQKHGYRIQFRFIAIRNTKSQVDDKPLKGMVETLAPAQTYTNIWNNNSNEVLSNGKLLIEQNNDKIYVLRLEREDKENIPLGWYLSDDARTKLNGQLNSLSKLTIDRILKNP